MKDKITKQILEGTKIRASKKPGDTIHVWEAYKEQALLWRMISLIQTPLSIICLIFAFTLYNHRTVVLDVPLNPLPGQYAADEIQDREFISVATEFVNLIATYQPLVAERQFKLAAQYLKGGEILDQYKEQLLKRELGAIGNTGRTQIFFVDPSQTTIDRTRDNKVIVNLTGQRTKIIAGEQLPIQTTRYRITMTTIPRNAYNRYGIVVSDVFHRTGQGELQKEDRQRKLDVKKQKKKARMQRQS